MTKKRAKKKPAKRRKCCDHGVTIEAPTDYDRRVKMQRDLIKPVTW